MFMAQQDNRAHMTKLEAFYRNLMGNFTNTEVNTQAEVGHHGVDRALDRASKRRL